MVAMEPAIFGGEDSNLHELRNLFQGSPLRCTGAGLDRYRAAVAVVGCVMEWLLESLDADLGRSLDDAAGIRDTPAHGEIMLEVRRIEASLPLEPE